jgi:FixJ family two-component response regulator
MKLHKKILIAHPDAHVRRRSVMLLAAAEFDVRTSTTTQETLDEAKAEWVDLAVIPYNAGDLRGMALSEDLRKTQPTLLVILTCTKAEFQEAVRAVKIGIVDVVPMADDPAAMASAVCHFFNITPDAEVSMEELSRAEAVLDCIGGVVSTTDSRAPFDVAGSRAASEAVSAARSQAVHERELERVAHERNALEAQLRTLLAQNSELTRIENQSAELASQRELISAAQSTIDLKSKELSERRNHLGAQRDQLEEERKALEHSTRNAASAGSNPTDSERARLKAWQKLLTEQAEQLRAEAVLLQQDRAQLAAERRHWHKDLDVLREQEDNLRRYEARLRDYQARMEADRVGLISAQAGAHPLHSDVQDDKAVHEAWIKLQRAHDVLETEKAHLREERLAIKDWEQSLKGKEAKLIEREARFEMLSKPVVTSAANGATGESENEGGMIRNFTKAMFKGRSS